MIPIDVEIFYEDGSKSTMKFVLDEAMDSISLPADCISFKLNSGFTGFYRLRYPQENLIQLGQLIRSQALSSIDTLNVISDLFALVKAGEYSVDDYLGYISEYLENEDRYLPLTDLANNLAHLYRVVKIRRDEISLLGKSIFERNLAVIGYLPEEDEDLLTTELRTSLLSAGLVLRSKSVSINLQRLLTNS